MDQGSCLLPPTKFVTIIFDVFLVVNLLMEKMCGKRCEDKVLLRHGKGYFRKRDSIGIVGVVGNGDLWRDEMFETASVEHLVALSLDVVDHQMDFSKVSK